MITRRYQFDLDITEAAVPDAKVAIGNILSGTPHVLSYSFVDSYYCELTFTLGAESIRDIGKYHKIISRGIAGVESVAIRQSHSFFDD